MTTEHRQAEAYAAEAELLSRRETFGRPRNCTAGRPRRNGRPSRSCRPIRCERGTCSRSASRRCCTRAKRSPRRSGPSRASWNRSRSSPGHAKSSPGCSKRWPTSRWRIGKTGSPTIQKARRPAAGDDSRGCRFVSPHLASRRTTSTRRACRWSGTQFALRIYDQRFRIV